MLTNACTIPRPLHPNEQTRTAVGSGRHVPEGYGPMQTKPITETTLPLIFDKQTLNGFIGGLLRIELDRPLGSIAFELIRFKG
jgi:hypothetical protein